MVRGGHSGISFFCGWFTGLAPFDRDERKNDGKFNNVRQPVMLWVGTKQPSQPNEIQHANLKGDGRDGGGPDDLSGLVGEITPRRGGKLTLRQMAREITQCRHR